MKQSLLRRSLLGLAFMLLGLVPVVLRPAVTWSAATTSETSGEAAAQLPQAAALSWATWQNLGDLNGYDVQDPVFGQNQDGHLEILAWGFYGAGLTDYAVYRRNQTSANGANWTGWASLGSLEPGTAAPAVARNPEGRLEVFAVGEVPLAGSCTYRSAIKQISQVAPNGGWSGWWNMGQPSTACSVSRPSIGTNSDGRLEVFTVGSDHNIYHRWQTTPSSHWSTSSSWTSLGTPNSGSSFTPNVPLALGNNADGRLALFVTAPNASDKYELYHAWQNTAGNSSSWNTWTGFGRPSTSVQLSIPVLARNQDGRLDVFVPASDGNLYHKWQVAPNSYWSEWENLGQPGTGNPVSSPQVIQMQDGRLAVFAKATGDGAIWYIAQNQPSGTWGNWTALSKPPGVASFGDLAVGKNQNGSLVIAATGFSSGALWITYEQSRVYLPFLRK